MSCHPNKPCKSSNCKKCVNTDSVYYTGEYLECTGIEEGDSLSVVLQKLDEKYCEIYSLLENCSATDTPIVLPGSTCSPVDGILSRSVEKETPKPKSSGCCNPVKDILNLNNN